MRCSDRRASEIIVLCVRGWTARLPASSEGVAVSATPTSRSKGEWAPVRKPSTCQRLPSIGRGPRGGGAGRGRGEGEGGMGRG